MHARGHLVARKMRVFDMVIDDGVGAEMGRPKGAGAEGEETWCDPPESVLCGIPATCNMLSSLRAVGMCAVSTEAGHDEVAQGAQQGKHANRGERARLGMERSRPPDRHRLPCGREEGFPYACGVEQPIGYVHEIVGAD